MSSGIADSAKPTYRTHLRTYFRFCVYFQVNPVPCSKVTLLMYVTFLARTLKLESIRRYVNIIRSLHLETGYSNALDHNYAYQLLTHGVKRCTNSPVKRKLPITPDILLAIRGTLDLDSSLEASFWAACVSAFSILCRKATLPGKDARTFSVHV